MSFCSIIILNSCEKAEFIKNNDFFAKENITVRDSKGNQAIVSIISDSEENIEDFDVSKLRLITKTIDPSFKNNHKIFENKTKDNETFVLEKNYVIIHIESVKLVSGVNAANVIYEPFVVLDPRWRGQNIYNSNNFCRGISTGTYSENKSNCSLEWAVNVYNRTTNQIGAEINRFRFSHHPESLSYAFPSWSWGDGFIFRWDEDGWGCGSGDVFLNLGSGPVVPHQGILWTF